MILHVEDFFSTTLSGGITAGATSMVLASVPTSYPCYLVLDATDATKREIVKVSNIAGNTCTLSARGVGSTAPGPHSTAAAVTMNPTAANWTDLDGAISNTSTGHDHDGTDSKLLPVASGANVDTGTDNVKVVTCKSIADSGIGKVKATAADINGGSDDVKYITAKAIEDSDLARTGDIPGPASGADVDTGTSATLIVTPLAMENSSYAKTSAIPVKASGAEVNTGSDDAKFVTPKAIEDSDYAKTAAIPVKASGAEVTSGSDDAKFVTAKAMKDANMTVAALKLAMYPVGAVYTSVVSTSPATLFGGTWEAFGAGRVMVGINGADSSFDVVEETGGAKTVDLSHVHDASSQQTTAQSANHWHAGGVTNGAEHTAGVSEDHSHSYSDRSGSKLSNVTSLLQPYVVVYLWKRTG